MEEAPTPQGRPDTFARQAEVHKSIIDWLTTEGVTFRAIHHAPTFTSEESAKARNEDIRVGGKAIVMKIDSAFALFVLSASCKVDSAAIKKLFRAKSIRFVSSDELHALTGLEPGCVPPFGRPILPFDLYIDESVTKNKNIAFNAGSLTDSIVMATVDYLRLAQGTRYAFSR